MTLEKRRACRRKSGMWHTRKSRLVHGSSPYTALGSGASPSPSLHEWLFRTNLNPIPLFSWWILCRLLVCLPPLPLPLIVSSFRFQHAAYRNTTVRQQPEHVFSRAGMPAQVRHWHKGKKSRPACGASPHAALGGAQVPHRHCMPGSWSDPRST